MQLRPYQTRLVGEVRDLWARGTRAVVMQLGTGGGKTHTAATLLGEEAGRVVFAAHLDSLVSDTAARLRAAGVPCGIVAPWARPEPEHRVQVCSLGTLHARGSRPPAELVVLDECHRSEAPTVRAILGAYPEARLLGLTATPQRGDGRPLGATWGAMAQGPTVRELTAMGALVPARMVVPADEGARGDLLDVLPPEGSRMLVFAESRAEGSWTATRLRSAGRRVAELYGETARDEREQIREDLAHGTLDAVVNVNVCTEGWDLPAVDCVALDAPFGTIGRYLQAIGRGLRPYPGKTHCTVLDLRGAVYLHLPPDVPHRWSLTGEAVSVASRGLTLSRCAACWAVWEGRGACPRCGAERAVTPFVPRRLQDDARMVALEGMDPSRRRALYRAKLVRIGMERRRMTRERAERWADAELAKRLG